MDWDKLRTFHAVALAGSFTKATTNLHISQSAISRQINILEDELGTPLFQRVARGLVLTQAGEVLRETVIDVFAKLAMTQASIVELRNYARGPLTVATNSAFGSFWLAPRLQEFSDKYPEVRVTLLLKKEEADFSLRDADVGVSALPIHNSELIHSKPIASPLHIYASRSYLDKYGTPQKPEDLDHHRLIVFGKELPQLYSNLDWLLKEGAQKPRAPYLVMNNVQAIYEATKSGIGISALHKYVVEDDPEMVEILSDIPRSPLPLHVMYPHHLASLKRVQVFVNFLLKKMQKESP